MSDAQEKLGEQIDRIDNLRAALDLPMPPAFHVEQMKELLTDLSVEIKKAFTELTGENPWK